LAVGSAAFFTFSIVAHKEHRFVFILVPIYLIGIAVFVGRVGMGARSSAASSTVPYAATSLAFGLIALINLSTSYSMQRYDRTGAFVTREMKYYLVRDDLMRAYLMLSGRTGVEGIIDQSTTDWYDSGGYYYLHNNVPLYRWDMPGTNIAMVLEFPTRFATHWLTETDRPPSPDYSLLERIGDIRVWERNLGALKTEIAPRYSARAPAPFEGFERLVPPSPKVKPAW
jgi:hypothetical protein